MTDDPRRPEETDSLERRDLERALAQLVQTLAAALSAAQRAYELTAR